MRGYVLLIGSLFCDTLTQYFKAMPTVLAVEAQVNAVTKLILTKEINTKHYSSIENSLFPEEFF